MKLIKKIIFGIFATIMTTLAFSQGETITFHYSGGSIGSTQNGIDLDFSPHLKSSINSDNGGLKRLLNIFMPKGEWYNDAGNNPSVLVYLKAIVNMLLSFVSLIALILMIYAFYMIFFKKDDAGITTAKQMIKGIVIALLVIGFSWIIVSFLFRFEGNSTTVSSINPPSITNMI